VSTDIVPPISSPIHPALLFVQQFTLLSQPHLQRRFANSIGIGDGCFCAPMDDMPLWSLSQSKGLISHYDNLNALHIGILLDLYYCYCAVFYRALSDLCSYALLTSHYHLCFLYLKFTVFYYWRTIICCQYFLITNHHYLLGTNVNFSPTLLVIAYHFFCLPESSLLCNISCSWFSSPLTVDSLLKWCIFECW